MNDEFSGELERIHPSKIVDATNHNKVDSFFITLGIIFNDLKGLILFEKLVINKYRKPTPNEKASAHLGNYSGLQVHLQKLMTGTINEFFTFLRENRKVFTTREFKEVLDRLRSEEKKNWDGIVAAACGRSPGVSDFLSALAQIRSTTAYHYDHSGKKIREGFISHFFNEEQNDLNKYAYYSIGETLELTRFYFSDAAVQEALFIATGKGPKKKMTGDISLERHRELFMETIKIIINIISQLLKNFLQLRRNRPDLGTDKVRR